MNRLHRTGSRLFVAGTAGLLIACNSSTATVVTTVVTTAVVVTPEDFLQSLPCSTDAGAMQTYRATLVDVTDGLDQNSPEVQSRLISCQRAAYFEGVTVGNRYIARVSGYPRSDLAVDAESGTTINPDGTEEPPTWTTTCYGDEIPDQLGMGGGGPGGAGGAESTSLGVVAYSQARVYVRACLPLVRASEPGETGAIIGIENSLGALECGDEPDMVDHFTVHFPDGSTVGTGSAGADGGFGGSGGAGGAGSDSDPSAPCGETVTVTGLVDGENYTLDVVAFEADTEEPTWGTTCRMTARSGVLVRAACESLQPLN